MAEVIKLNSTKQRILSILILITMAAGCSLPTVSAPGPRAWIDFPLDGSTIELGAVVVFSHASDPVGVAELELYVDGELARVDATAGDVEDLAAFEQVWTPPGNGSYILQVRAKNSGGSYGGFSNQVHLTIGDTAQVPGQPPPVSGVSGDCPTPDASTKLYINQSLGYCFLYLIDHSDDSSGSLVPSIVTRITGPRPATTDNEVLLTSFAVSIEDALGRNSSEFAQDLIDQGKIPGSNPVGNSFDLDGETALWTEELGSLAGARSGFLVHDGLGYSLTLIPNGGDFADINIEAENLWVTITVSWKWFDGTATPIPAIERPEEPEDTEATFLTPGFCRRGPSSQYDTITGFEAGTVVQIEGRNAVEPRWLWVLIPDTSAHCWISDSVVDVSGSVDDLPIIAAPPLPPTETPVVVVPTVATAPAAPSGLMFTNQVCDGGPGGGLTIALSWNDNANNETGYRVYRDGVLVATLAANSTTYSEIAPNKNSGTTYNVEAFNVEGASAQISDTSGPCPIG